MYRGSRLAASFLLMLTGFAALALGAFVVPAATPSAGAWFLAPLVVVFAMAHFVALVGLVRGREWARDVAMSIAEAGGGLAIAAGIAIVLGANPFGAPGAVSAAAERAQEVGLAAWLVALYALLGISAGRARNIGLPARFGSWPRPATTGGG
jgi:hypothetical protein